MYDAKKKCNISNKSFSVSDVFAMFQISTYKSDSSADCWEAGLPGEALKHPHGSLFLLHW